MIKKGNVKRRLKKPVRIGILIMSMVLALFVGAGVVSNRLVKVDAAEGVKTVDTDTTNNWENVILPDGSTSTQNVGRIWTDKSVFDRDYTFSVDSPLGQGDETETVPKDRDSDFLVALSALGSMSNLKTTTTTMTPLDIVLVLDVSGSMGDNLTSYSYNPTYRVSDWGTYYAYLNDRYVEISKNYWDDTWSLNGQVVNPKTSENDNDPNHIQFYSRNTSKTKKITALKNAVNSFIDSMGEANDQMGDPSDLSRIAIVKFADDSYRYTIGDDTISSGSSYNSTQVVSDFTSDTSALSRDINGIDEGGGTAADYGLTLAEDVLKGGRYGSYGNQGTYTGARSEAKKVVIFFTDGEPNHGNGWDGTVANSAIKQAGKIKAAGTTIYTVGVFSEADPSDTSENFNKYMHGVSSNFPNAESYNNLGERVPESDYYKAATSSDELSAVFDDIFQSESESVGSGSPIEEVTQEGASEAMPGNLTFTDTLGNYMQITKGTPMSLVYANEVYKSDTGVTSESEGVTTYSFSGTVSGNDVYAEANLSEIKITVTPGSDPAGDTVTVQIPASLIPLRNYQVDTDAETLSVSEAYPIRLLYNVSLKQDAKTLLSDSDPLNKNYETLINTQKSEDGTTIDFYSNNFVSGSAKGSTTATFTPSDSNKFYYFTENTALYTDNQFSTPATKEDVASDIPLYFKDTYWAQTGEGDSAAEGTFPVEIAPGSSLRAKINTDSAAAYIPAGTHRTQRPGTLTTPKEEENNPTGTAGNVLTAEWADEGETFVVSLGNNGKLSYEAPGELEIKKTVDWGNASEGTKNSKNSFKFTVHLYTEGEDGTTTALNGSYPYVIYGTDNNPINNESNKISDEGSINLSDGQRAVISGLPNGAKFTVSEASVPGFSVMDSSQGEGAVTDDGRVDGTIVGCAQQSVSFTNTYHAKEVSLTEKATLKVQKNLTGREWQDSDQFFFTMRPKDQDNAPDPDVTEAVSVDKEAVNHTADLSNITFTDPGEYTYVIAEDTGTISIPGIDYSNETYAVTVNVVDNGEGELEIDKINFEQLTDVDGNEPEEQPVIDDNTVVFTNEYNADADTIDLNGTKVYTDTTGANPNEENKFTFKLTAIGGYATNGGSADDLTIDAANVPMPEGTVGSYSTTGNKGTNPDGFGFKTITYTGENLKNTYLYEISEVIPAGATDNHNGTWSLNGMTYDGTVYSIAVSVDEKPNQQGDGVHIVATPNMTSEQIVFNNTYDPEDAVIEGNSVIHGTKSLTGRQINDNDAFFFQLTQTDGPATVTGPQIRTVTKESGMDFSFDRMTFPEVGKYTFNVNEVADADGTETTDGSGMTYSKNNATVTVNVTDSGDGALAASVSYANQEDTTVTDKAVFTNVYTSSMNYGADGAGGIAVTKQMTGRPMAKDEFEFSIEGLDDAAKEKLTDADSTFKNSAAAMGQAVSMRKLQNVTFNQDDAGKTFSYLVSETVPEDAEKLPAVVYDQTQYRVDIAVFDNGDGSMHTVTTVTKVRDENGNEIDPGTVIVNAADSSAPDYKAPTFGFVNDYSPEPVSTDTENPLQVTKTVTGAPSPEGTEYSFTLTATGTNIDDIEGLDGEHKATVKTNGIIKEGESQTLSFGELKFKEPGTYTFTVKEDAPTPDDGWTFDASEKTITVTVSAANNQNQYDGKLYISSITGSPAVFTNTYEAEPVTLDQNTNSALMVQKTVTGYNTSNDFTFTIEPEESDDPKWENVSKVDPNWNGTVTISDELTADTQVRAAFGGIEFSKEGSYTFKVTEIAEDVPAGWTYDTHEAFVTVNVTDTDYDGFLEASVTYDNRKAVNGSDQNVADASAFTNSYKADAVMLDADKYLTGIKKLVGRNGLKGETFGFTLSEGSVAGGADWSAVSIQNADGQTSEFDSETATAAMEGKSEAQFTFSNLTFSKAGTYVFNVNESEHNGNPLPEAAAEPVNGMTYDRHTGTITVTVTDDGSGKLSASASAGTDNSSMTFVNSYSATPVTYGADEELLGGHKYIDDQSGSYTLSADTFEFIMRAQDSSNPMPVGLAAATDDQGRKIVSVKNSYDEGSVYDFGEIQFSHENMTGAEDNGDGTFTKSFQYNLFEGDTDLAGITKDNTVYTVTFTVTEDQEKGEMSVDASAVKIVSGNENNESVGMNQLDFTNIYNPTQVSGYQNIYKTMSGRDWNSSDSYTFNIAMTATELDGTTPLRADVLPLLDGTDAGGTVSQTVPNENGNGYSWTVTIAPSNTEVSNTYRFNTGTLTYSHVGIYTYTISENPSKVNNVASDPTVYTVVVTVTDNQGGLSRSAVITPEPVASGTLDFTNTYTPTPSDDVPTDFELKKVFTGHEWTDQYPFEFVLSPVDGAPMPKAEAGVTIDEKGCAHRTVSGPDAGSKDTASFNFGAISYEKDGTYKYTVTEVNGGLGGVSYDGHTAEIEVKVVDKDGQLAASATVTDGTFTNTYTASADYFADGKGGLDITKVLSNRDMAADQFSFTITATGDNAETAARKLGISDGLSTVVKSTGADAGTAVSVASNPFNTMKFDQTDDGAVYQYTIQENGKSGEGEYAGYVLDSSIYTVRISPADNGDGTMSVTTSIADSENEHSIKDVKDTRVTVPFENRYEAEPAVLGAEGSASIRADKKLLNDDIANYDGKFNFAVMSGDQTLATGVNGSDGSIVFSDITYTTEELAKAVNGGSEKVGTATLDATGDTDVYTFNYTVVELTENLSGGVTANKDKEAVTVTVTDDRHGKLAISVSYPDEKESADFVNTYGADASYELTLSGNKVITGESGLNIPVLTDGTFTFTITGNAASDGTPAPMPEETSVTNKSGSVSFGPIVYTMENVFGTDQTDSAVTDEMAGAEVLTAGRTKVFTYSIAETGGSMKGVTNDTSIKNVEVTVTDNGDGKLSAAVTAADPGAEGKNDFTFRNLYSVITTETSLTGDGGFNLKKTLTSNTDRVLEDGEYTFQLINMDGSVAAEAVNDAEGNVYMPAVSFNKPGTYSYLLKEAEGSEPGVVFDSRIYNVTAEVTDNGDGTLSVAWKVPQAADNMITFDNTYTASPAEISLGAAKVLSGRDLVEGEFTFQLKDQDGNVVSEASNSENGAIQFEQIDFIKPGEYRYSVSEVKGDDPTITYDDTVYTVTVNVTDDRAGHLKASLSVAKGDKEADSIVFANTYTAPETPDDQELPATGNWNNPVPYAAAAVLSIAAIGAILFKRLHKNG